MDALEAWVAAVRRSGARGNPTGVGSRLLGAYVEPHRTYHDRTHLEEVLRRVDELAGSAGDVDVVRLAAWFHDAVYDPARGDNEERSAAWAEKALGQLGLPAATVDEVARLVRLTTTHAADEGDHNGAVLCDADLAVLAADPERYAAYAAGVRQEYAAVGDADFTAGRARVLQALVERPALYATGEGRRRWEARARHNVAAELARLSV